MWASGTCSAHTDPGLDSHHCRNLKETHYIHAWTVVQLFQPEQCSEILYVLLQKIWEHFDNSDISGFPETSGEIGVGYTILSLQCGWTLQRILAVVLYIPVQVHLVILGVIFLVATFFETVLSLELHDYSKLAGIDQYSPVSFSLVLGLHHHSCFFFFFFFNKFCDGNQVLMLVWQTLYWLTCLSTLFQSFSLSLSFFN